MNRKRVLIILKQRVLPIIGKCLLTGTALGILIISNIIAFIKGLDKKGKVRLALCIAGCFIAILFFINMKEGGCAPAFIKSIAFSSIATIILIAWLEFFGVDVILGRHNAE